MRQSRLYLIVILLVTALAVGVVVRTLASDFRVRESSRLAEKTQTILGVLTSLTSEGMRHSELTLLRMTAEQILRDPEVAGLQVVDPDGYPMVDHPPAQPAGLEAHTARVGGTADETPARVRLWISPARTVAREETLVRRMASGAAFLGFGLMLPLCWVLGGLGLMVRQAREALDHAKSGDLNHPVQGRMHGEFGELRDQINATLQSLRMTRQQADAEKRHAALAEGRVAELIGEHRRTESVLLSSERSLKAIFDQSPYWMGMIKHDGSVQSLNRGIIEYLGVSQDAFSGKPIWDLPMFDHGDARKHIQEDFKCALEGRVATRSTDLSDRSGRPHHIEYTLKPVFDDRGQAWKVLLLAHEVTSQILAEQEIKEREAQVQQAQKMDALGQLAGGIAHDFNNLLTSILGFSQMVMDGLPADAPGRKDLREVLNSAERAKNLTLKLLNLARKRSERIEPTNLNQLIRSAEKLIRLTVHENIEYVPQLDDKIGYVEVDPVSTEQIIVNLAVNARDAMPRSGRFYVRTKRVEPDEEFLRKHKLAPGSYVELSVRDTGCGMEPEILPRIFEPFFTTKEPGQGTGLGLSTVYNIVRQYKGAITVDSRPGAGTEFKIYFPEMKDYAPPDTAAGGVVQPLPTGSETLLLVEDEDGLRRMGTKLIESLGYKVYAAKDGQDGLEVFRQHMDDILLVISDVVMPVMSGPDMIRRMRGARRDLKFLFVSGFTADKLAQHGVSHLEGAVINKPYSKETLARRIRELLDA